MYQIKFVSLKPFCLMKYRMADYLSCLKPAFQVINCLMIHKVFIRETNFELGEGDGNLSKISHQKNIIL